MTRQDRVDELRHDRFVVADDAREKAVRPACSFRTRLSRTSCLTGCDGSRSVAGRRACEVEDSHDPILYRLQHLPAVHYTDRARGPFFFHRTPAPRVRASRRQRAGARKHDRRLRQGLSLGADGLELDVHLSRDGASWFITTGRWSGRRTRRGGGGPHRGRARASRRRVSIRPDQGHPFRGRGIGVPTLAGVLDRYRDAPIIIELKMNVPELARATLDVVRSAGALDRVCLGSFGWRVLREARRTRAGRSRPVPLARKCAGRCTGRGAGGRLGRSRASATRATRCQNGRAGRGWSRADSWTSPTGPGWAYRSGPSTRKPTRGVCSGGASMG